MIPWCLTLLDSTMLLQVGLSATGVLSLFTVGDFSTNRTISVTITLPQGERLTAVQNSGPGAFHPLWLSSGSHDSSGTTCCGKGDLIIRPGCTDRIVSLTALDMGGIYVYGVEADSVQVTASG